MWYVTLRCFNCKLFKLVPTLADEECCPAEDEPGNFGNPFCTDGVVCCGKTGQWTCSIGDGRTFPCGRGSITKAQAGERCGT